MKVLVLALALCGGAAHADLYRWVDRETGNVKFSTLPPPWYGDAERQRNAPPVEVIQYRGGAGAPPPPAPEAPADARRRPQEPGPIDSLRDGLPPPIARPPAQ